MNSSAQFKIRIATSFSEISQANWDALIIRDDSKLPNPFITHAYLSSLEESGSATRQTGWLARHLLLEDDNSNLIGALPCYAKNHSQGEYVFDHGWADAFERAGGNYYPKLQCAIPFTPASGPRFLSSPNQSHEACREALAEGLKQLSTQMGTSSAHITFLPEKDWKALEKQQYLLRTDQQFHWENNGYQSFAEFLNTLSSRKRKNIRKERQTALRDGEIEIEFISGNKMTPSLWDIFFGFYTDTGSRKWGQPYLTREFYTLIGEKMGDQIVLIFAKRENQYIAGAINFIGENTLFGRHWGCAEYHPALHFEVCYYQAIEYAIQHGLKRVEAGAQGGHKLARGYMPVTTYSAHWIEHPGLRNAIENFLDHERQHVKLENEELAKLGPFRKNNTD